jgi:hypothetical protein
MRRFGFLFTRIDPGLIGRACFGGGFSLVDPEHPHHGVQVGGF